MIRNRPGRLPRRLAWAAVALLALYALYLVAGNAFLHSRAARDLVNRKPEKFRMEWAGGHTLWPGHVSLRGVRMEGHVRRVGWAVEAEHARGRIALWPLLRREVRLPRVDADGLSGSLARAAGDIPPPEYRPGGWTLRIDRIVAGGIRGGELFGWKLAGNGRAEVGFRKRFHGGEVELFPSAAHFDGLAATRDGQDWLRDARLDATFALAPHRSADYPGLARLQLLAASLDLDGSVASLRTRLETDGRYQVGLLPGEGRVTARLALAGNALQPGGRVRVQAPLQVVDARGDELGNTFELSLDVDEDMRLRASAPEVPGHGLAVDADLRVPGRELPLQDWRARLAQAVGHARGRWHVPSIGALVALFAQADWLGLEGSGTVEGDLRLEGGRLREGSRLAARDVVARADVLGSRFSGRAHAEARIEAGVDGTPRSRVSLVLDRFAAAPGGAPSRPYVEGGGLRVDLEADARLAHMRDSSRARIRFNGARVPDLARFDPYLPNDRLRFGGGSGTLDGDLHVDGLGDVVEGTLRIRGRQVDLSVAGVDLRGDVEIDGRLRRGNLRRGNFDLGGTRVELRNVSFSEPGGATRSGWWAMLELERGQVEWKHPASLGGRLQARMKDVGFLLAMFADRARYPAWISRVVDAGEARVEGLWQWRDDALVLDRVRAANDRFDVAARMRLHARAHDGDLYVGWRKLGVGVELRGGRHRFHLRNAREWFDSHPHLLP